MKKNMLVVVLLLISCIVNAQGVSVPYRVGDKFGVADTKGKMIIPAKYDIVEPQDYNGTKYYIAYTIDGTSVLSTLIYNNKIVLADQAYKHYYISNGLITAAQYTVHKVSASHRKGNHSETKHIYDLNGKKMLPGDYSSLVVRDDIDEKRSIDEILIYTTEVNGGKSLYLYNKKLKKITRTLIDNAQSMDIDNNYDTNWRDRSITHIYMDKNGAGRKLVLRLVDKAIAVELDEPVDFRAEQRRMEEMGRSWTSELVADMPYDRKPEIPVNSQEEKIILNVRKVKKNVGYYYLPKKIEEIVIEDLTLKKEERYIISKNNKQGLFFVYNNSLVIPVQYDEILWADFPGNYGGNILRNGKKYGMIIYSNKNNKTIEPLFDKIPVLEDRNYFGDKMPLIKLYDENGKLFCYADENGKLFYKP